MSDNNEWVQLNAKQAKHVEKGTTVRVEGDGVTVIAPLSGGDSVVAVGDFMGVYVENRRGSRWFVQGTVSVSPEVAARVIEQADPVDAGGKMLHISDESQALGEWQPGYLIPADEPEPEPGELSEWQVAICPDDDPLEATNPACQTCWLTHPDGACDR